LDNFAPENKNVSAALAQFSAPEKINGDNNNTETSEIKDPLLFLLVKKVLINEAEGKAIISSGSLTEERGRLANLLPAKGLITTTECEAIRIVPTINTLKFNPVEVQKSPVNSAPNMSQTTPAAVIPAITPLRVLPLEGTKRNGLIPDIKLGSGAKIKLYGFFKTSAVWDFFDNDTTGLTGTATATLIDGSSSVIFGFENGQPVFANQKAVRGYGGFINLRIPLSRLFKADPKDGMTGWTAYLHYGLDGAYARDARRRRDVVYASLQYKFYSFITFAYEQSLFRTRAVNNAGSLPRFRGIPSRETQNIRSEFATIFNF
jgi:hypothetical protein